MSCCLSLVLLIVTVARGEHTCSFYVSLFLYFLGQLPLTSLSGSLCYKQRFHLCSHRSLGHFCVCELTTLLKAPTSEPGFFRYALIVCLTRQVQAILSFGCYILDELPSSLLLPTEQKNNDVVDSSSFQCRPCTRCGLQWHGLLSPGNPWGFRATLRKSSW